MSALLLTLVLASPVGRCDPVGGPGVDFTEADRGEVYSRVIAACGALGGSESFCQGFMVAVVWRESRGKSSVRHTRGTDEDGKREAGLGSMGHSLRWQGNKWPGNDDPDFCLPEVNVVVQAVLVWRAYTRYNAVDWIDVQAVMSGHWVCDTYPDGRTRSCGAVPTSSDQAIICGPMGRLGYSCREKLKRKTLGKYLREWERIPFVEKLIGHAL